MTNRKIFISYARTDSKLLAHRLCTDLQGAGYTVWLDTSEIGGGASWSQDIEEAIEECSVMVALMSPAAYQSQWCRAEQLRAVRKGKKLLPIMAVKGAEVPLHLEHLNYLDFSQTSRYGERLQDLLSDLRAGEAFQGQQSDSVDAPRSRTLRGVKKVARDFDGEASTLKRGTQTLHKHLESLRAESWLGARRWWPYFLFYVTDVPTAVKILQQGEVQSAFLQGSTSVSRWDRSVRFYFRPRTPDLFVHEGFKPRAQVQKSTLSMPVYLLFDLEMLLSQPGARFAYGDPAKTGITYSTPTFFKEMPFEQIYHDSWFMPDQRNEIMRHREAQALIPDRVGLEGLQFIWMRSPAEYETLHSLLSPEMWRGWRDKITPRTDYHLFNHRRVYVERAALLTDSLHFTFNLSDRETPETFTAQLTLTWPDGRTASWQQADFTGQSDWQVILPEKQPGYTVRLTLDDELAYQGQHRTDSEVL
jgi:hypothetical protein